MDKDKNREVNRDEFDATGNPSSMNPIPTRMGN